MAATRGIVKEFDTRGGSGVDFVVAWKADKKSASRLWKE
jgi:hypothetical protein